MTLTLTITAPALLAAGGVTLASGVPADASVTAQPSPCPSVTAEPDGSYEVAMEGNTDKLTAIHMASGLSFNPPATIFPHWARMLSSPQWPAGPGPRKEDTIAMSAITVPFRGGRIRRITLLLPALALALGVIIAVSVQQPASAATPEAHSCVAIGTLPNGNQAVVCSDIELQPVSGGVEVWGEGEYYCQGPDVQCNGIHADNNMTFITTNVAPPKEGTVQNNPYQCVTTACPSAAPPNNRAFVSTPHRFISTQECDNIVATVSTGAAILPKGTSQAFHPQNSVSVTRTLCGNSGTI